MGLHWVLPYSSVKLSSGGFRKIEEIITLYLCRAMTTLSESLFTPTPIILSIFGSSNTLSKDTLHDALHQIIQELGTLPNKLLLPSEGNTSIYLQDWAEALHIHTMVFFSDWVRNGKMAQILRDDRMAKEGTHAIIFITEKATKRMQFAKRLSKKKQVFTIDSDGITTPLAAPPSALPQKASAPARKSSKETGQTLLKFQTTAAHGTETSSADQRAT